MTIINSRTMCIARIHFTHSCKHRWLRILTGTVVTIPNDGSRYARLDCLNDELRNFDLKIWKNVKSLQKPETHLNNLACLHSKINFVFLVFKRSVKFLAKQNVLYWAIACVGKFFTETVLLLRLRTLLPPRVQEKYNRNLSIEHFQCCLLNIYNFFFIFICTRTHTQEEGGTVTQTDVIRAYDTNLPKPTGGR